MIIGLFEDKDRKGTITFHESAKSPYEVAVQGHGRQEVKTFTAYEDALRWAAAILEMPHLLISIDGLSFTGRDERSDALMDYFAAVKRSSFTVDLAADGTHVVVIQGDGQIRYYDRAHEMWVNEVQLEPFDAWAVTPDGQTAVIIQGHRVEIWDLATMKRRRTFPLPFKPMEASIWPDNQTLALTNKYLLGFPADEKFPFIQRYDLVSGRRTGDMKAWPAAIHNILTKTTFSPKKDWVAFGIHYDGPYAERIRFYIEPTSTAVSEDDRRTTPSFFRRTASAIKSRLPFSLVSSLDYLIRYQGCAIASAVFTQDRQTLFLGMSNSDHHYYNKDRPMGRHIHVWQRPAGQKVRLPLQNFFATEPVHSTRPLKR